MQPDKLRYLMITLVAVTQTVFAGQIRYNVIDLSSQFDGYSISTDINNRNQITGYSFVQSADSSTWLRQGFVYRNGTRENLFPAIPDKESISLRINDQGIVVGCTYLSNSGPEVNRIHHACYWSNGSLVDLGTFGGMRSIACGINDHGQIAGYFSVRTDTSHRDNVFVKNLADGSVRILQYPGNWKSSNTNQVLVQKYHETIDLSAYPRRYTRVSNVEINDNGDVVASFTSNEGENYCVLWRADTVLLLNDFTPSDSLLPMVAGINDSGSIVGLLYRRYLSGGDSTITYPVVFRNGIMEQLEYISERGMNWVGGINDYGKVVGQIVTRVGGINEYKAAVWNNKSLGYLNDSIDVALDWDLNDAEDINDSGFIVGAGTLDGKTRAFLLAPKPPAVVLPTMGRVTVTLTDASATLVSDVLLVQPDSILLIANNLLNVGTMIDTIYQTGTELRFAIAVHGRNGTYVHYSDGKFAKVEPISGTEWIIRFEDLPEDQADWDYNDVVIRVVVSPVLSIRNGSAQMPARRISGANVLRGKTGSPMAVYDVRGRLLFRSGTDQNSRRSMGPRSIAPGNYYAVEDVEGHKQVIPVCTPVGVRRVLNQ